MLCYKARGFVSTQFSSSIHFKKIASFFDYTLSLLLSLLFCLHIYSEVNNKEKIYFQELTN